MKTTSVVCYEAFIVYDNAVRLYLMSDGSGYLIINY